jgi:hypothetical protein
MLTIELLSVFIMEYIKYIIVTISLFVFNLFKQTDLVCVSQHFQQVTSGHNVHRGNISTAAGREAFAGRFCSGGTTAAGDASQSRVSQWQTQT